MSIITVLITRYCWGDWRDGHVACIVERVLVKHKGHELGILKLHLRSTIYFLHAASAPQYIFFMLLCLITSQLHLLVLVLPAQLTTFTFNLAVQIKPQRQLGHIVLTHIEI